MSPTAGILLIAYYSATDARRTALNISSIADATSVIIFTNPKYYAGEGLKPIIRRGF